MTLRVVVAGRDPLARAGLVALLARDPGLAVLGDWGLDELDEALAQPHVEAVVVDAGPSFEGVRELDALPAVALVASDSQASDALAAGARAVLLRDADAAQLAAALHAAVAGLTSLDASIAPALLRPRAPSGAPGEQLTPRETEVLQLLPLGLSNKQIAGRLGISEHTAKFHVNSILGKLGAGTRAEAVVRAARLGLVAL